jgi:hypothetical protein
VEYHDDLLFHLSTHVIFQVMLARSMEFDP